MDVNILVAWLYFDLEEYDQAAALYRHTFDVARDLDDVTLQAFLLGRMSRTLSECGHHTQAVVFADAAQRVAGTTALPAVRSWLAVTGAYVHACLGNDRACRTALDDAVDLHSRADDEPLPPYIAFYGHPYLDKWTGHALLRLAEQQASVLPTGRAAIDDALRGWSDADVRESAEVFAAAASARVASREIDEAARLTSHAYDIAVATRSPRVLRYSTDLRERMRPYRHTPAVRALDEHLLTGR